MLAVQNNVVNLYDYRPLAETKVLDRPTLRISSKSKYGDNTWDFSDYETNPNVKATGSILRWDFNCGNEQAFNMPRFNNLRMAFKELIYALASCSTGKAPSPATLKNTYTYVKSLIKWLINNHHHCISQVSRKDLSEYITLVNNDNSVHPGTKVSKLSAIKLFWLYQEELTYFLSFDPLEGKNAHAASGVTREDKVESKYDFIPDDIAQNLIRSCVSFIREDGALVAAATQARDTAGLDQIKSGKSSANRDRARKAALEGMGITNAEVTTLSRQLLASCYLVIAFFTGTRASEMLSMEPDQITKEGGVTWISGRQYKIEKKARKWMAPDIVFEAHSLAKSLTQSMRDAVEYELSNTIDPERIEQLEQMRTELFLNWSSKRKHGILFEYAPQVSNIHASIHTSLKELVKKFDVTDADGHHWNLHPHQLRKTFVRFMCSNAMNIRYLQEHMGHRSLDMTAWYDSDDVELTKNILKGIKEFKNAKLGSIFYDRQKSTGAAAEAIENERRDYFVGIATDADKESFIADLADDITMRSTGHSWCLGDSNNGNCTGVVGCMMDITMTQKCKSALITDEHLDAWLKIKARNEQLLNSDQIGKYQKEAIAKVITETIDPTIAALTPDNQDVLNA
tara:strand:+ start:32921 stop:34798 length:1878 start_codon:yes stop_codon:yes gene_type:complete